MRALIDTCIVIDALQNRSPFANDARAIFYAAADNRFDGYVTAKSTADIYYLMHRYTHSDKETRDVLRRLGSLFEFLDTSAADGQVWTASLRATPQITFSLKSRYTPRRNFLQCSIDGRCFSLRFCTHYSAAPHAGAEAVAIKSGKRTNAGRRPEDTRAAALLLRLSQHICLRMLAFTI